MRTLVLTTMENSEPKLPPMDAPDGYCLHYEEDGLLRGGFSCLHHVALKPNTCVVLVEASAAVTAQMLDDPKLDIQWWEEVADGKEETSPEA